MLDAPIAESQNAARNPPCIIPTGLQKRSSAVMVHTVTPGSSFLTHTMPSVRSQGGGTCTPGVCGIGGTYGSSAARKKLLTCVEARLDRGFGVERVVPVSASRNGRSLKYVRIIP